MAPAPTRHLKLSAFVLFACVKKLFEEKSYQKLDTLSRTKDLIVEMIKHLGRNRVKNELEIASGDFGPGSMGSGTDNKAQEEQISDDPHPIDDLWSEVQSLYAELISNYDIIDSSGSYMSLLSPSCRHSFIANLY